MMLEGAERDRREAISAFSYAEDTRFRPSLQRASLLGGTPSASSGDHQASAIPAQAGDGCDKAAGWYAGCCILKEGRDEGQDHRGPVGAEGVGGADEFLAKSGKKTVQHVTQSESTHGRDGMSHHITVTVWYE